MGSASADLSERLGDQAAMARLRRPLDAEEHERIAPGELVEERFASKPSSTSAVKAAMNSGVRWSRFRRAV